MQDAVRDQHAHERAATSEMKAGARITPDPEAVAAALEAGEVGVWSWDIATDALRWSGNLPQIYGMRGG